MKGWDAGGRRGGGLARGKAEDDDTGAHCGVRRIEGSKSDYQLVSEARLRYSLAFTVTFYCPRETMAPLQRGPAKSRRGARDSSPEGRREIFTLYLKRKCSD